MEITSIEQIVDNCKEYLLILDSKMEESLTLVELVKKLSKASLKINSIITEVIEEKNYTLPYENYIEISTYIYTINKLENKELYKALPKLRKFQNTSMDLSSELNLLLLRYDDGDKSPYYFNYQNIQERINTEYYKINKIFDNIKNNSFTINNLYAESVESMMLQETYFGKNTTLLNIEKYFDDIKKIVSANKNPNLSKELKQICTSLEKMFNFEKLTIEIIPDNTLNAYTLPMFLLGDFDGAEDFKIIKDKTGIKYKSKKNKRLLIVLHSQLVKDLSSQDIIAVLLHEIGHNFFLNKINVDAYKKKAYTESCLRVLSYIVYYISVGNWHQVGACFSILIELAKQSKDPYNFYKKQLDEITKNDKNYKKELDSKSNIFTKIAVKLLMFTYKFFSIIFSPLIFLENYFLLKNKKNDEYINEKFADNFANSYGYPISNFIYKVLGNSKPENFKIPIYGLFKALNACYTEYILFFSDEHPDDVSRLIGCKNKLKHELDVNKKDLTPDQIKTIEQQLEDIDRTIKGLSKNFKLVYAIFGKLGILKNKIAMHGTTDEEIYDFDKTFLKDFIEESYYIDAEDGEIL